MTGIAKRICDMTSGGVKIAANTNAAT